MIIANIKSSLLKIDNYSKGMRFAIFVYYKTISIFWAPCSNPGKEIMRPWLFCTQLIAQLLFEAFSNVNLDKFSLKFFKNLTHCPNFIQIFKKVIFSDVIEILL